MIIGASLDAEPKAKKAKLSIGITFPVMAESETTKKAFEANLLPTLFLVGQDGKVLWKGYEKTEQMMKALEAALEKK